MIISLGSARVGDLLGFQGLFAMELVLALISLIFVLLIKPFHYENMEKN